jgi:hypothetical protein
MFVALVDVCSLERIVFITNEMLNKSGELEKQKTRTKRQRAYLLKIFRFYFAIFVAMLFVASLSLAVVGCKKSECHY